MTKGPLVCREGILLPNYTVSVMPPYLANFDVVNKVFLTVKTVSQVPYASPSVKSPAQILCSCSKSRVVVCYHCNQTCLTAAGYVTTIYCSWSFAIITPVSAVDLKYPIVRAVASMEVLYSLCVITTHMLS